MDKILSIVNDFYSPEQAERIVEEDHTLKSQPLNKESEGPTLILAPLSPGSSSKVLNSDD